MQAVRIRVNEVEFFCPFLVENDSLITPVTIAYREVLIKIKRETVGKRSDKRSDRSVIPK
jgi:hypothetical protein